MPIIEGDWRRAGPGKFEGEGILGELIYNVSMEGVDDEIGEADTTGWYGIMRGGKEILQAILDDGEEVTEEEAETLRGSAGVIVSEDSQGFFSVGYYDTKRELEGKWKQIVDEISEMEEEGEGEDYE